MNSIVILDNGPIEGLIYDGYRVFKGIPYAQPPIGALRWSDPLPAIPWSPNTLNATCEKTIQLISCNFKLY